MNQLQNLLHDALIATNHVEKCALIDLENDNAVRASSVGFHMNKVDVESLVDAFDNAILTRERGIFFEDALYRTYRADDEAIYAKEGSKGVILVRTKRHILMGTFTTNMYPSVCVEAIEKLADYFKAKDK